MALDRRFQQIALFPYSGVWTGARYPALQVLSGGHRVMTIGDLLLFYYLQKDT